MGQYCEVAEFGLTNWRDGPRKTSVKKRAAVKRENEKVEV